MSMVQPTAAETQFAKQAWLRALQRVASIDQNPDLILPVLIDRVAERYPSSMALVSPVDSLSYLQLAQRCRQYARWGISQGLKPGDSVCLAMANCAEYLAVWLGLSRIGVIVALANTQLSSELLTHAIEVAAPRLVIAGTDQASVLAGARPALSGDLPCWVRGPSIEGLSSIDEALLGQSVDPDSHCALPPLDATALFIYTSGTTGLPKAARVSHRRVMQWSLWFAGMLDTRPEDRMYDCLPLYHSVGGVVATGATLVAGGTVIIRERFSASTFWRDIREERCTLFQYIGELCRYLVNTAADPAERDHSLRIACGNGLRPEIWKTFQSRFRIPRILEYYAATEGTFSLYNCEGEPGAIGRIPPYLRNQMPVELLRFDAGTAEPWRDPSGFCQRCGVDEVGEAVGRGRFEGYADVDASERKMLRDVFARGDAWYRTGDLMRRDARGFYYFVDRVGDTFRWKGENVSTMEVQSVLSTAPGVLDAIVYGVTVPNADGRAGMAALIVEATFDVGRFRQDIAQRLPGYARPVFVRILPRVQTTGTFKPIKRDLVRASFDPALSDGPMFYDSPSQRRYVPLDDAAFCEIQAGRIRI